MKSRARALLLLNGELRDRRDVKILAQRADIIVCADGGARHTQILGVVPDVIIGDMDSVAAPLPRAWKNVSYLCDFDENRSDLDKALDFLSSSGAKEVSIAGALGGGLDHELVNLAALEARRNGPQVTIIGGGSARLLGSGRYTLDINRGNRFSLLAAPRVFLTLTGAHYPLHRTKLVRGSRGLGNRAEGRPILTVHSGRVWFIHGGSSRTKK